MYGGDYGYGYGYRDGYGDMYGYGGYRGYDDYGYGYGGIGYGDSHIFKFSQRCLSVFVGFWLNFRVIMKWNFLLKSLDYLQEQ